MEFTIDKAKWHYEGDFPKHLKSKQGAVHIGMYLGWIINSKLHSEEFEHEYSKEMKRFLNNKLSPTDLILQADGVLHSDMLNETGVDFSIAYYNSHQYTEDYADIFDDLLNEEDSLYEIQDTLDNFLVISKKLDSRLQEFLKGEMFPRQEEIDEDEELIDANGKVADKYHSFIFLGKNSKEFLWEYKVWTKIFDDINSFYEVNANKVGINTDKYDREDKYIKLGRINWREKSQEKWTISSDDERFGRTSIWYPSERRCIREEVDPNMYFLMRTPYDSEEPHDQFVQLSIKEEVYNQNKDRWDNLVRKISVITNVKNVQRRVSVWNIQPFRVQFLLEQYTTL